MKKILFILLFMYNNLYSQNRYTSASVFGSTPIVGFFVEKTYLNDKLGFELGGGVLSASIGSKFYPKSIKNELTPYMGLSHYLYLIPSDAGWKTYFPFGMTVIRESKSNIRIGIDLGPNLNWYDRKPILGLNFSIRFGYKK